MPDRLIINDNEDLKKKLSERIEKIESGKAKMLTVDEAFEEIKEVQIIAVYYSGSNWQKNIKYR